MRHARQSAETLMQLIIGVDFISAHLWRVMPAGAPGFDDGFVTEHYDAIRVGEHLLSRMS